MKLPTDAQARKNLPIATGVIDYFPLALAEIARISKAGNDQHNPGQPLHWDKTKSTDHADCIGRHLIDRGTRDGDGQRHSGKLAWRALALLETELEAEHVESRVSPTGENVPSEVRNLRQAVQHNDGATEGSLRDLFKAAQKSSPRGRTRPQKRKGTRTRMLSV